MFEKFELKEAKTPSHLFSFKIRDRSDRIWSYQRTA